MSRLLSYSIAAVALFLGLGSPILLWRQGVAQPQAPCTLPADAATLPAQYVGPAVCSTRTNRFGTMTHCTGPASTRTGTRSVLNATPPICASTMMPSPTSFTLPGPPSMCRVKPATARARGMWRGASARLAGINRIRQQTKAWLYACMNASVLRGAWIRPWALPAVMSRRRQTSR